MDFKKSVDKLTCTILLSTIKSFYYEVNRGRNRDSHQLVCGYLVSRVLEVLHVAISKSGMDLLPEMQSVLGSMYTNIFKLLPYKLGFCNQHPLIPEF